MNTTIVYIGIVVGALVILGMLAYASVKSGRPSRLTPMAALAFVLVLAGIVLGQQHLLGYGLIALGVILALIDILQKSRGPVG
ncbi:MAG TPA: hypothetical protein VFH29_09590 [Anaerolineales bacterium]|nr:hypothetical protein [Anaerolineales bacterium]